MPSEERYIKFSFDEVHEAITHYANQTKEISPPKGPIRGMRLNPQDGKKTILCDIQTTDGRHDSDVIEYKPLAMALINICKEYKIPLPRQATKVLSFAENQLIMKIDYETKSRLD
ncbi:MAG: hypothetical protein ACPGRX_01410 [Bdellovibrionales bacterium]